MKMQFVALIAGTFCGAAASASTTTLRFLVSLDGQEWSHSVRASSGQTVQAKVTVSFDGPGTVGGLSSMNFQPVIANWGLGDEVLPYVRDLSQRQGHVAFDNPLPGQEAFGRLAPFASVMLPNLNDGYGDRRLAEHVHVIDGTRYLRIAQSRTTNWLGQGATYGTAAANNFNGGGGISIAQPTPAASDYGMFPPDYRMVDVPVFKFAFVLGAAPDPRTLYLSVPASGLDLRGVLGSTARRGFGWFLDQTFDPWPVESSDVGQLLGSEIIVNPAPWSAWGLIGVFAIRRRR